MPKTIRNRGPVPFNLADPGPMEASRSGVPEFTSSMEKDEVDQFAEQERWRKTLSDKEKELDQLQKQIYALD